MSTDFLPATGPIPDQRQPTRRGLPQLAGLVMAGAGMLGVVAVLVPGWDRAPEGGTHLIWRYPPFAGLWAVAVLLVGCAVAVRPQRVPVQVPAVGGLFALLLAGEGFVAVRDWFNVAGASGVALSSLADVVTIAAATSIAALFAAGSAVYLAWPALDLGLPPRRRLLVAARLVAVAMPVMVAALSGQFFFSVTAVGTVLVLWALPWACALTAAAYATRRVCRYLTGAVVASGLLILVSVGFYPR